MNEKNNFDIVRLTLAIIVMLVHSSQITKNVDLHFLSTYLSSDFAVKGFFSISGFLIVRSCLRSKSIKSYFIKRAKRIAPAYFFVIALCFFIGLFVTNLSCYDFILNKETIRYIASNLLFLNFIQPSLPGVFTSNPLQAMNGSLWTIKAEITLYILLPFVIQPLNKNPIRTMAIIFLVAIAWFFYFTNVYTGPKAETIAKQFIYLSSFFFFGSLFSINDIVFSKIRWISLISISLYFYFKDEWFSFIIEMIAFPSVVIFICTSAFKELKINKLGDLSYGVYLYHFPIIQSLQHFGVFDYNAYIGLSLTVVITFLLSYASWHLLENKFLKRTQIAPAIEPTIEPLSPEK